MYKIKSIWKAQLRGRPLENRTTDFAPFAGPHPTRIYWYVKRGGSTQEYAGKWSTQTVRRFLKLCRKLDRTSRAAFYEFDRTRTLMYVSWHQGALRLMPTVVNGTTQSLYHPFTPLVTVENLGLNWALKPFWLKKIRAGKRVWNIYSTFRALNATTQLEPFRRTIEGIKWS